jgi:hypothetical protein
MLARFAETLDIQYVGTFINDTDMDRLDDVHSCTIVVHTEFLE